MNWKFNPSCFWSFDFDNFSFIGVCEISVTSSAGFSSRVLFLFLEAVFCSWEFFVGVCRPVLQILTLFQTKKCHFSHPFSYLASKKLCDRLRRLAEQQQRFLKIHFEISYFSFLQLIWNLNDKYWSLYTPVVPSKTKLDSRQKLAKFMPIFRPKRRKTLPLSAAHTCMAYIREYTTPGSIIIRMPFIALKCRKSYVLFGSSYESYRFLLFQLGE